MCGSVGNRLLRRIRSHCLRDVRHPGRNSPLLFPLYTWPTLFLIPWTAKSVVAGFFLFRLIDIAKPFPIRRLEEKLPGGWGVVGDDILAGIYANVVLRFVIRLF